VGNGLIWEVKTDDGGLRDRDHSYTWYNTDLVTNNGGAGTANGGSCYDSANCDTEKYPQQVNVAGLCGANDWRMPTKEELLTLKKGQDASFLIDHDYFPNTKTLASYYWSSLSYDNSSAWYVRFHGGNDYIYSKSLPHYIRLVRGGQ